MKTLIENFKCLVMPQKFVGLTFRKRIVGYVMLIMLIAELLFYALPIYLTGTISQEVEAADREVPDFIYRNGKLDFNSGKVYTYENDNGLLYINTSAECFVAKNEYSEFYFLNYVGATDIDDLPDIAIFISRTNCVFMQKQQQEVDDINVISLTNLMSQFNITTWDKPQMLDALSKILLGFYAILFVFGWIGNVVGIFFYALLWGLIAFLINRTGKIKYLYGRMYRLAVYVTVPMRVLRMLCIQFAPLSSSLITMLYGGLVVLYLILAIFLDENKKNLATASAQPKN